MGKQFTKSLYGNQKRPIFSSSKKITKNVRSIAIDLTNSIVNVGGRTFPILHTLDWSKIPLKRFNNLHTAVTVVEIEKYCDVFTYARDVCPMTLTNDRSKNYHQASLKGQQNEIFFDRDPRMFNWILQACLKKGEVSFDKSICPCQIVDEMKYWGIDESYLSSCCATKLETCRKHMNDLSELVNAYKMRYSVNSMIRSWDNFTLSDRLNLMINYPTSSKYAEIYTYFDAFMVISSIFSFVFLSTKGNHSQQHDKGDIFSKAVIADHGRNHMKEKDFFGLLFVPNRLMGYVISLSEFFEVASIFWFSLELSVKFYLVVVCNPDLSKLLSTQKRVQRNSLEQEKVKKTNREHFQTISKRVVAYLLKFSTWIDILAVIPFYLHVLVKAYNIPFNFQAFKIMRVVRILKLGRYSDGLRLLGKTVSRSKNHLISLFLYLSVGLFIIAFLVYFIESKRNPQFKSIFDGFWWAVITITTVGYGSIIPETLLGRLVASVSFFFGVIAMGLPIHPIIANFSHLYRQHNEVKHAFRMAARRKELERRSFEESVR